VNKKCANKCETNPQNILLINKKSRFKNIGLYKKDTNKPNQKELHSGQRRGLLIYGILEIKFLIGPNILEKPHITVTLKDNDKKYNKSKKIILKN